MSKHAVIGGKREQYYVLDKTQPIVSIIIVTYNAEKFIENCLQSIAEQSYTNIELLIFDGESTDKTIDKLKANERIISYWQSEPDDGIYDAMNKAFDYAKGNWLYFIGADDTLLSGFSDMCLLLKNKETLYYGYCLINNKPTGGKLTNYNLAKVNVCHHAVFYPAVVFQKYKYNVWYNIYADHALNIQCWGDRSIKKKFFNIPIAIFNKNGYSSFSKDKFFKLEKLDLIKKNMGFVTYYRCFLKKRKELKNKKTNFFLP